MIDLAKLAELRKLQTEAEASGWSEIPEMEYKEALVDFFQEYGEEIETLYRENARLLTLNGHVSARNIELDRENAEMRKTEAIVREVSGNRAKLWMDAEKKIANLQAVAKAAEKVEVHHGLNCKADLIRNAPCTCALLEFDKALAALKES